MYLYISEFGDLPITSNGVMQSPDAATWQTDQTPITISGTSAPSQPFGENTRYIVISADVVCSVAWTMAGENTVAALTTNVRIPADELITFGVSPGMKVSAIANS